MCTPDGHPWQAATLDLVMAPLRWLRPPVVSAARGRVLELGVGTGANLRHYRDDAVVTGIEPDPHMLRRAQARAAALGRSATLVQAGAGALPFPDESFDTAVVTWVFCTIPAAELDAAVAELRRVLVPGGTLHYVEHVASPFGPSRWIQTRLNPLWGRLAGGCQLDREPAKMLRAGGFSLEPERSHGTDWTPFPLRSGRARRA